MEFQNKYSSELRDEDIIPFTAEALEVVETVVSFFCECLNKNEPKFITLMNGNLSPKKEDIDLHPSLDNDPTEKICQETTLYKKPTVFKYGNPEDKVDVNPTNDLNTSFDEHIDNADKIINKIENEFANKKNYDDSLMFSSDSEDYEEDGAPACVLAEKLIKQLMGSSSNEKNEKSLGQISLSKKSSGIEEESHKTNKSQPSTAAYSESKDQTTNEEDDLDFQVDESVKRDEENEVLEENDNDLEDNKEENGSESENNKEENANESENFNDLENNEEEDNANEEDNFNDGNFEDGDNFEEGNFEEGNFEEGNFDEGNFNEGISNNELHSKNDSFQEEDEEEKQEVSVSDNQQDADNEEEYSEQNVIPTPMANTDEIESKFASQLSISLEEQEYYNNPDLYHDSNDEINFIPIQEKINSNCIRWKYHIKHHSTNKKLRCSNFLIIWSQPTKINPVPKATAEMWMVYYHTSNVGRNDATITYRFNGYYNTHEINVQKFMTEYKKYKENPNVEIMKKDFPLLYTPLVLNPKKWLPELIRSKLLISNDIMNKKLLTD